MAARLIEHIQSSKFGEIITTYNDGSIRVIASQVIPYRDYNSDTLAPQVGEVSANMADSIAVFEVTHEAAAKYVGKNPVNPGFNILSAEMMLRYLSWGKVADLIFKGVAGAIAAKTVTYHIARARSGISTHIKM